MQNLLNGPANIGVLFSFVGIFNQGVSILASMVLASKSHSDWLMITLSRVLQAVWMIMSRQLYTLTSPVGTFLKKSVLCRQENNIAYRYTQE